MTEQNFQDCIAACEACAKECINSVDNCRGHAEMEACKDLCRTCADICFQCADECRLGTVTEAMIQQCSDACRQCAEECEKHDNQHCRDCAEECRICEEACNSVLV